MNTSSNQDLRNLNIMFDAYGEDDPVFKVELIELMIANVHELRDAAQRAFETKNGIHFRTASHKTKSTIQLLDDAEFIVAIDQLKEGFASASPIAVDQVESFRKFADAMIRSLERETQLIKGGG